MFNKKLGTLAVLAAGVAVLGACGPSYDDTVLADNTHSAWVVAGSFAYSDDTAAEWNYHEKGVMTATSVADVATISTEVADHLAGKNLKALYKYEGAKLGTTNPGWNADAMKDGEKVSVLGSYAVKAIQCDYDAEEETWNSTQWIADPHTAYAESITPSTLFMPPWVEEPDEQGFSWSSNPVCIGGAGTYTIIVAQYNDSVSYPDTPNFGMALVKTAEGEEPEPEPEPATHTYGLIGSFNEWGADVAMTKDASAEKYTAELTTAANDEWKIRQDGAWTVSYGGESLGTYPAGAFTALEGGNIQTVTAGTYNVELDLTGSAAVINIEAKVA